MGITYFDDITNKSLDRKLAYQLQVTKFESDTKLIKSKIFYVSLETLKTCLGDQDYAWETIEKGSDGKWNKQ